MALAGALERHETLESARVKVWIAREYLVAHRRIMRCHQSNRLHKPRVQSRLAPGLLQKQAAVKRLMLRTNDGQSNVGVEVNACDITQPHRRIGKFRKTLRLFGVGDKAGWVDKDPTLVKLGVKQLAEQLDRWRHPPFRRQHADTDRAAKLALQVDAKGPGIRRIVVFIAQPLRL